MTSPYQKREDFSKLGKQLIEKTPSNNEISKLKETYTPKKNDPLNENLSHSKKNNIIFTKF